ncbi:hypothetical protein GCM10027217_23970 [Pseudomaricurvus hydrocarbonicus]
MSPVAFAEPALPAGLEPEKTELPETVPEDPELEKPELENPEFEEPELPAGMSESPSPEPALPDFGSDSVFDQESSAGFQWDEAADDGAAEWLTSSGFGEVRAGTRTRDPIQQRHTSLAEARLALDLDADWRAWHSKLSLNLLYDDVADSQHVDLDTGEGWLDLREAWVSRRVGRVADLKAGRQILTWGVGDLLFINDLFPKDWNSFLAGRDEQYLKAPSDALRMGFYSKLANLNVIYAPRFDSDRFISGDRLSYYNQALGEVAGRHAIVQVDKPDHSGEDDELALRVYRNLGSFELAVYGYEGFWNSPAGFDAQSGLATFPALRVYGASVRGPVGPGIFSSEMGYYDSRDDQHGRNPWVNNSEWRALLGYEWEPVKNTTLGVQYYVEQLQDYDHYRESLAPGQPARDEHRQVVTVRLTHLAMNQNLTLGVFGFYSPSDQDLYLRPSVSYKLTDNWLLAAGLNLFSGDEPHTFFGQFESNSNAYLAVRFSF